MNHFVFPAGVDMTCCKSCTQLLESDDGTMLLGNDRDGICTKTMTAPDACFLIVVSKCNRFACLEELRHDVEIE